MRAENSNADETIIVTAQRREESLGDVALSLSAFDGETVAQRQWRTSEDIAAQTPRLVATSFSGSSSIGLFAVRGVAQNDFLDHQEAPVAVYVDEAYRPFTGSATVPLFDVERVEVLRGPQGTLFGRNATGGLVNIVTRKPAADFDLTAMLRLEEFGGRRLELATGGAIAPGVQVRIAGVSDMSDGYFRVLSDTRPRPAAALFGGLADLAPLATSGNLRNRDEHALRFSLAAQPAERIEVAYSFEWAAIDRARNGYDTLPAPLGVIDPAAQDFYATPIDLRTHAENPDLIGFVDKQSLIHTLGASYKGTGWRLDLLGTSGSLEKDYLEDDDGGPFAIGLFGTRQDADYQSLEVRASAEGAGVRWTAGASYLELDGDYLAGFQFPAFTGAAAGGVIDGFGLGYDADYRLRTRAWAAFGQADLALTNALTLVAGFRLTQEDQLFDIEVLCLDDPAIGPGGCAAFGVAPGSVADDGASRFTQGNTLISGKASLEYRPTAGELYWLSYNRGVKGGGFSVPLDGLQVASRLPYDPETLHAFEAGARFELGRTTLSASGFAYIYDDYQGYVIEGPTVVIDNFAARIFGGEIELATLLPGEIAFAFGVAALNARVQDVETAPGTSESQRMTLAPELTLNGALSRRFELGGSTSLTLSADGNFRSSVFFNTINSALVRGDGYALVNTRAALGFDAGFGEVEIAGFVRNLTDARPVEYSFDLSLFFGNVLRVFGPPRTAGVEAHIRF